MKKGRRENSPCDLFLIFPRLASKCPDDIGIKQPPQMELSAEAFAKGGDSGC